MGWKQSNISRQGVLSPLGQRARGDDKDRAWRTETTTTEGEEAMEGFNGGVMQRGEEMDRKR